MDLSRGRLAYGQVFVTVMPIVVGLATEVWNQFYKKISLKKRMFLAFFLMHSMVLFKFRKIFEMFVCYPWKLRV